MSTASPLQQSTRILFICHDGQLYGAQKSLKLLIENLPADQYEIYVSFARSGPLAEQLAGIPNVTVLEHDRIQGAKHSRRNLLKQLGDACGVFLNVGRVLPLVELIQVLGIDIVHTNSLISFEGALAAKLAGVPHVWHIRERFGEDMHRFNLILGKRLTQAMVYHFSSRVICISDYVRAQFEPYASRHPKQYEVVPNAIPLLANPEAERQPVLRDSLNVLYLGRISDGKRFQDLLEAFCLLKRQWGENMPFKLKAYGDFICPRFEHYVWNTIEAQGLAGSVQVLGYRDDIEACFEQIDLLAMPSSTEAFGRTILDALTRGLPVVVPNAGAAPEIVLEGETGFFYEANSPESLARCLEARYNQREQLPAMADACIRSIRDRFSVEQQIERVDAVYQTLLRRTDCAEANAPTPCRHGT